MPQMKTLRNLKKVQDNPNAKALQKEIEHLESIGNKERAKLLKKRYQNRYGCIANFLYSKRAGIVESTYSQIKPYLNEWKSEINKLTKANVKTIGPVSKNSTTLQLKWNWKKGINEKHPMLSITHTFMMDIIYNHDTDLYDIEMSYFNDNVFKIIPLKKIDGIYNDQFEEPNVLLHNVKIPIVTK